MENVNMSMSTTEADRLLKEREDKLFRFKGGVFLTSVAGFSAIFGFGATLASAKKKDPQFFSKGMVGTSQITDTGAHLALRALGWGTLYAITGTSLICYGIWKISGAKDIKDFRIRMGNILPRVPRNDPPLSRTEFTGLNDLLTYISTEKFGKKSNQEKTAES